MSGSGGGGGGGGVVSDAPIACELLRFETQITSPNVAVVRDVKEGDVLYIQIATASHAQEIQVLTADGDVVGGLLSNRVQRLRECILGDHNYQARVLSVNGGQVRVAVEST